MFLCIDSFDWWPSLCGFHLLTHEHSEWFLCVNGWFKPLIQCFIFIPVEVHIEPQKCPGIYCGRVLDASGNYSDCGVGRLDLILIHCKSVSALVSFHGHSVGSDSYLNPILLNQFISILNFCHNQFCQTLAVHQTICSMYAKNNVGRSHQRAELVCMKYDPYLRLKSTHQSISFENSLPCSLRPAHEDGGLMTTPSAINVKTAPLSTTGCTWNSWFYWRPPCIGSSLTSLTSGRSKLCVLLCLLFPCS